MSNRLFIVSNRLPFYTITEGGTTRLFPSGGGLITALKSYLEHACTQRDVYWVGAPGCEHHEWHEVEHLTHNSPYRFLPVLVEKHMYEGYYNGFSNSTLWPVFHSLVSYTTKSTKHFEDYIKVNRMFFDVLINHVTEKDLIWIHDYHLLPLASMLREHNPDLTIGLFLHTPFPSQKIFNFVTQDWQKELLRGMSGANLIGFQTKEDARNFYDAINNSPEAPFNTALNNRKLLTGAFPASIDFEKFNKVYDNESICHLRQKLKEQLENRKIIFSVDRLDYTKGLYHRLKAYQNFLISYPQYREKVVFIMIVFPSLRKNLTQYEESKALIESSINLINKHLGNSQWQPVIYFNQHLSFNELVTLYSSADLALITPLKDGMNLVAKEFVASRKDKRGVLVLSKMVGASLELAEALLTDPYNLIDVANKIKQGLEMSEEEQEARMESMQRVIEVNNVKVWGDSFLNSLKNSSGDPGLINHQLSAK